MKKIDASVVKYRYRELGISICAETLGVVSTGGIFLPRSVHEGICALGIMVLYHNAPMGATPADSQQAVNEVLEIDPLYSLGFFYGFAQWDRPVSLSDAHMADLVVFDEGRRDGEMTHMVCDPISSAKITINKAAHLIEQRGWSRGSVISRTGRLSIESALRMVLWGHGDLEMNRYVELDTARSLVEHAIHKSCGNFDLDTWNDHVCPNELEAVSMLRLSSTS